MKEKETGTQPLPVAVLLAVHDKAEAEQIAAGRSRSLRSIFAEAHEQIEKGGGIPHDQFWREVEQSRRAKKPEASRGRMRCEYPPLPGVYVPKYHGEMADFRDVDPRELRVPPS